MAAVRFRTVELSADRNHKALLAVVLFSAASSASADMNTAPQLRGSEHADDVVDTTEMDAWLTQANITLDDIVNATLGSDASGCFASNQLLRRCGAPCFGRAAGGARRGCIDACLRKNQLRNWCAECYGRRSDCTMSKCLQPCARAASGTPCTSCVHAKCGGACR